ncbi:Oxygen-dependent choline dehydrogenase [Streptomyces sp. enrichment culture]|uniref:GMC family oxidoreductase N-terminal domain-containing protein n=1 Tax=Streptomyces sp. enrichment culture TaxID=1795815 RepID=UPI003F57563B
MKGDCATCVEVERDGELLHLRAEREVVLSAGAYNSPQLLMLSGIGPGSELASYGITPRVDLPVGENLQDHPYVGLCYLTGTESLFTAETPENVRLLETEGRGPHLELSARPADFTAPVRDWTLPTSRCTPPR